MKKRIISVILVVVAFLSVTLFQNTFAWFTVDTYLTQSFIVGDVNYTLEFEKDEEATKEHILPGDQVFSGNFTLTNKSTIDTELRFKIVDTVRPNAIDNFVAEFENSDIWTFKETDGYYYYGITTTDATTGATVIDTVIPEVAVTEDGEAISSEISFIESIKYNGETVEKDQYSGQESTVTLIFQAKQGEYATWEDIGEFKI